MEVFNIDVIDFCILFCLVFVIGKFYWLTVFFLSIVLLIWGIFSLLAPVYLSFHSFSDGETFIGITTILVSIPILIPCLMAYKAAWKWLKREMHNKTFFRKWNALNFWMIFRHGNFQKKCVTTIPCIGKARSFDLPPFMSMKLEDFNPQFFSLSF